MGGSCFGNIFKISTFGESHGEALGVVIDGLPAGLRIDREVIRQEMARRRPGQSLLTTSRQEDDQVEILSGILDDISTGTPMAMLIRNTSQRSGDYRNWQKFSVPDTLITVITQNTASGITGAADVLPGGKPAPEWPPVLWPKCCCIP